MYHRTPLSSRQQPRQPRPNTQLEHPLPADLELLAHDAVREQQSRAALVVRVAVFDANRRDVEGDLDRRGGAERRGIGEELVGKAMMEGALEG